MTLLHHKGGMFRTSNCGPAKANKSGQGKSATLTYGKRRFYLKTPKMRCPFAASLPKPKPGEVSRGNEQYSLQLEFGDDAECQVFQQKASEFDAYMINEGIKPDNSVGWLGASKTKPYGREVVESKYSPMIKYSKKDGEVQTQYPPFMRANFPTTFKEPFEFTCEIYDKSNKLIPVTTNPTASDSITKVVTAGCWCSALLSGSIWCNNTGFGVTWRVAQLKVFPPKGVIPKGKCLMSDPDDEEEEEEEEKTDKKKKEEKDPEEEVVEEEEEEEKEKEKEKEKEEEEEEVIEEEDQEGRN